MSDMSKTRRPADPPPSADEPLNVYLRLDRDTSAALVAFVGSQLVPPSNAAVALKALHEFLQRNGHWPPAKPGR